jgi:hypothetical protein
MSYRPYDTIIQETLDLIPPAAEAGSVKVTYVNSTGSILSPLTVVSINSGTGNLQLASVSIENTILSALGITEASVAIGAEAVIVHKGQIQNVTTSLGYGPVFLNKDGTLTNTQPNVGINGFVDGDFVLKVGAVSKNKDNPLNKDFIVDFSIVGQL